MALRNDNRGKGGVLKRVIIAVGLSALTHVGGHFYNRRWDRALLFLALLAFWIIGVYASMTFRLSEIAEVTEADQILNMMSRHWTIGAVGTVVLWGLSLVTALLDARRSTAAFVDRWTISGLVGAVGFSLLATVVLYVEFSLFGAFDGVEADGDETPASTVRSSAPNFYRYVQLGHYEGAKEPTAAPTGDGYLAGRFEFEGKPAAGVRLNLVLNGKYETAKVTTDADGEFHVRLPRGEWYVSRVITHEWQEPPTDGDFVLVTGQEPKLVEGRYNDNYWLQSKGIRVQVGDRPPQPQLTFTIRKGVALRWPEAGAPGAAATVDDGVIAWDPYAGANTYLVRIVEVEREGRTTSYHEVATKAVVGATNFPLKQLQVLPSADAKKEYEVSVVAFDEAGNLLSQSERFGGGSFVLSDARQLVREQERMPGSEHFDPKQLQQVHDNNRRIEAAAVLLKDGMDKEAERLLGKIQGKVDPGKQAAVTGFLMAVRGRCAEANRLFAQAQAENAGCVPDHYRAGCKK